MNPVVVAARDVLAQKAATFRFAGRFLPARMLDDAAIVYAVCRLIDDTADEAPSPEAARAGLDALEAELTGRAPPRPLIAAVRDAGARGLPMNALLELMEGARGDLTPVRVADEAELVLYGYRVAGTVGLLMCWVLGVRDARAARFAVDLGVAMQITNIMRDVAEDAARNRVYVPAGYLASAGVVPDPAAWTAADGPRFAEPLRRLGALADRYYASADDGMRFIPLIARPAVLVAARAYRAIGVRLLGSGANPFRGRVVVGPLGKVVSTLGAFAALLKPHIAGTAPARPHNDRLHAALRGRPGCAP